MHKKILITHKEARVKSSQQNKELIVAGMMSGTSADGIDIAIISTDGNNISKIYKPLFKKYPSTLRKEILDLSKQLDDIPKMLEIANQITMLHVQAFEDSLKLNKIAKSKVDLIGFHGQTIYHNPQQEISLQIGNAPLLASETGIDVVAHLRDNDIANGGEGAPIVPIYHKAIMNDTELPIAIFNIGGVSNITALYKNNIFAGDIGPGNALLDDWIKNRIKKDYDKNGEIAHMGNIHKEIVEKYVAQHKFFNTPLPKSLDRNEFNDFTKEIKLLTTEDGAATLACLTATSISYSLKILPKKISKIILTGGGRKNLFICQLLENDFKLKVINIDECKLNGHKLDGDFIEAEAMAFIAARSFYKLPYTFPNTTGVKEAISGGVVYKART